MKLPRQKLLEGSRNRTEIEALIDQAEYSLRIWEPLWSAFIAAPVQEEAMKIIGILNEVKLEAHGGYSGAERKRILISPTDSDGIAEIQQIPIIGIRIEGNFLFDKPSPKDIQSALIECGANNDEIGDIWVCNDRSAEAACTTEAGIKLNGTSGRIRDISFSCEKVEISDLRLPAQRITKKFVSIESSTRVDAIASAGFGISRSKIAQRIKEGKLRLNWLPIKQSSKELEIGDKIQLENKGTVEVMNLQLTKRQKWRVEILRN